MKLYRCRVHHAGNRDMAIDKSEVTPAEIVLLKHVHGVDAVVAVEFVREGNREQAKERARLSELFGKRVFGQVYPGAVPRMPVDLAEAGLREDGAEMVETDHDPENDDVTGSTVTTPLPEPLRRKAAAAAASALT